jgi:D-beta-D-heptose 7-phosphate kinase / D-beta-D-heptose 1-phosphate adenosyltransferase
MHIDLARLADAFAGLRVTVFGDPLLDIYLEGHCERLCREAPIPVVQVDAVQDVPGGAGNVAVNAAALGAKVRLIGLIGDDTEGARLKRALETRAVPTEHLVTVPRRHTVAKQRLVGDAQILARFDQGSADAPPPLSDTLLCERLRRSLDESDVLIVSDYGYGSVSQAALVLLANRPRCEYPHLVADGRDLARLASLHPTAVKPSYDEVTRLLRANAGTSSGRVEWVTARADAVLACTGARIAAVTLDRDGALVIERNRTPYRTYARPAHASRSTGSGDTFVTALALALGAGADTPEAAEIASAAAAVVVRKNGTATCSARELHELIAGDEKRMTDLETLQERMAAARAAGKRVVFTNGCFDILHRGHVTLLNRAKGLGDVLIVGVNSDASVRRLKGATRPINSLDDRVKVLAALSYVDYVTTFDTDSPRELISEIRPDIYVKGGDYTRETLPETNLVESLGGAVCILPFVEDRSTTNLIARIRGAA